MVPQAPADAGQRQKEKLIQLDFEKLPHGNMMNMAKMTSKTIAN